jgi:hypothetical protein
MKTNLILPRPLQFTILAGLLLISTNTFAQFSYKAWNVGINRSSMTIKNGMSRTQLDQYQNPYLTDSIDAVYKGMYNATFQIEALTPNVFVAAKLDLPIRKVQERDSASVIGKHMELTMKFAYGFDIKDVVGIQFGLNMGIMNVTQSRNLEMESATKWDYFVPSGGTPGGDQYFGGMAAWEIGLIVNTVVAINDKMGVRLAFSHNNLSNKKKTISGRNEQFEFAFYYADPERHNLGFTFGIQHNSMRFKGSTLDATRGGGFPRLYPAAKVLMTSFYLGVNIPIVFNG